MLADLLHPFSDYSLQIHPSSQLRDSNFSTQYSKHAQCKCKAWNPFKLFQPWSHKYVDYDNALRVLSLQSLRERREGLCLKFASKCLQVPKLKRMFPGSQHDHDMSKMRSEYFRVNRGLTERLRRSAIPHMQRLLNKHQSEKRNICKQISDFKPVNSGLSCNLYHWDIKDFHYSYYYPS